MSLVLNIDTALETALVSIARDGSILQQAINRQQRDHGAFLQVAIQSILKSAALDIRQLNAVAVVQGPGSYTGLRVGMATAKGLCYAIDKPLIVIGTLPVLAYQAIQETHNLNDDGTMLFCPMVDARRMEVFTALYDTALNVISPPTAVVLNERSFAEMLNKNKIMFFGNGAAKWQAVCNDKNALFVTTQPNALYMSAVSFEKYKNNAFADLAYVEPLYIKEFYEK